MSRIDAIALMTSFVMTTRFIMAAAEAEDPVA
jgi:hypothetical protein